MEQIKSGLKFGKWTIGEKEGRHWTVQCECGTQSRALPFDLKAGKTKMCKRCSRRGIKRPEVTRHGFADSPTQWVWSDMKRRCYSPGRRGYENYGGRGIRICDRWLHGDGQRSGFHCFLLDMGERPSREHQIDRIDNNGNYSPENCRWVLRNDQNYNKRNTLILRAFGRAITAKEAEAEFGIPRGVLYQRVLTRGMDHERALTQPVQARARRS